MALAALSEHAEVDRNLLIQNHARAPQLDPGLLHASKVSNRGDELPDLGQMVCISELLGRVVVVPVELIHPNPHQPREHFDEDQLNELEGYITNQGLQKELDVTVVELPGGEIAFGINDGERRYRVLKRLGMEAIPCKVIFIPDIDDFTEQSFTTNEGQAAHNVIERAKMYKRMIAALERKGHKDPEEAIAKRYRKKVNSIKWHLELLELPPELQRLIVLDALNGHGAHQLTEFARVKGVDVLELARQCLGVRDFSEVKKAAHHTESRGVFARERVEAVADHILSGVEGPVSVEQIEVRRKLLAAYEGLARAKKTARDLSAVLSNPSRRAALTSVVSGRGGYPPAKLLTVIEDARRHIEAVEAFFAEMTLPPELANVPGKPPFLQYVQELIQSGKLAAGTDSTSLRQAAVICALARASDEKRVVLSTKEVLALLPDALRLTSTGMSPVYEGVRRAVAPHGLSVEDHEKYEKTERGFEKVRAYRLAWKPEEGKGGETDEVPPEVLEQFPGKLRPAVVRLFKKQALTPEEVEKIKDWIGDEEALRTIVQPLLDALPKENKPTAAAPVDGIWSGENLSFYAGKSGLVADVDQWNKTQKRLSLGFGQRRALGAMLGAGIAGLSDPDTGLMENCASLVKVFPNDVRRQKGRFFVSDRLAGQIRAAVSKA